jgi:hypothetical protein
MSKTEPATTQSDGLHSAANSESEFEDVLSRFGSGEGLGFARVQQLAGFQTLADFWVLIWRECDGTDEEL